MLCRMPWRSLSIQMNFRVQYFPVVLLIMLYKVVLTFESVDEIRRCDHSNESYWAVLSCGAVIMLYKVVLTFESVGEILKCDHSNKSYWAVLSRGAINYDVHGGSNFWVCGWNLKVWPFKWKWLRIACLCTLFVNLLWWRCRGSNFYMVLWRKFRSAKHWNETFESWVCAF